MADPKQPKPIPMKKTYQPTTGSPAGRPDTPRFSYGGKPLKGV